MTDATALSLADFQYTENDDPLDPGEEYLAWRRAASWATDLYEPNLLGPAVPRVELLRAGMRRAVINLTSYNYMGFAHHPEVVQAAQQALARYGTGACGSPLLSGMAELHSTLEGRLSRFMKREATMLYNAGYSGAMGGLAGLLRKGDECVLDAKVHLSLIDGANLSRARVQFFEHNDPASLDQALSKCKSKRRLMVVEGIYSMDGDMANLPALLEVAERHGCRTFIDEAHSILAWGAHGRGVTEHFGVEGRVGLVFATCSKAFAGVGGFISGRKRTLDYLRYYSHPYGFSCAPPPAVVAGFLKVLEIATRDGSIRERLWENSRYFREQLVSMGLDIGQSTTQVVPIIIGSDRRALYELCREMNERGLFLAPVDFPSVPEDKLRFRCAVTAAHTRHDLDEALQIIEDTVVRRLHGKPSGRRLPVQQSPTSRAGVAAAERLLRTAGERVWKGARARVGALVGANGGASPELSAAALWHSWKARVSALLGRDRAEHQPPPPTERA